MKFIEYLTETKGSFLDNKNLPKLNQKVWFLSGMFGDKPEQGTIIRITNIDNKGLSNTSVDLKTPKGEKHVNIMLIFDHKPQKHKVNDEYGEVSKWV